MTWGELRHWIFRRNLFSGAILGCLLGIVLCPAYELFGIVVGLIFGFLTGGAVGIGTGLVLTASLRWYRLTHRNHILNMFIVGVLFVLSNMLFTILLVGGTPAVYGTRPISELISVMFSAGIIPALLSAIPAIWYTPAVIDNVMQIEWTADSLKQKIGTNS